MAYSASYSAGDVGDIIVDVISGVMAQLSLESATLGDLILLGVVLLLIGGALDRVFGIFGGFTRKL